jgi:hypothetical protein
VTVTSSPSSDIHALEFQYQIRFLGCKGMVAIDDELSGIKMCLRPSMKKFQGREGEFAEIEIARAFDRPNYSCESSIVCLCHPSISSSAQISTGAIHTDSRLLRHSLYLADRW